MNTQTVLMHVETALEELRQGRMLILMDDDSREQEGDLVIAAEKVTSEAINFLTKEARGLICLALSEDITKNLQLPLMPIRNSAPHQAAFTISIDAAHGIDSGTSTADRAYTIRLAADPRTTENDIATPGHVFPLRAKQAGVLARPGHTEGSVDLARLAGLRGAAVVCEILNDDGTMARLPQLRKFAEKHQLKMLSINDIIQYRLIKEGLVDKEIKAPEF